MTRLEALVVCIGNVCRSPLAERLLAQRLGEPWQVASAGVAALAGSGMDADAAAQLETLGGSGEGFVSRQLTPPMVRSADLVLTATVAIRSRVLEDSPGALRRTFTLRELALLLEQVPAGEPRQMIATAAAERSRAAGEDLDVADPFRRGTEAHEAAAAQVDDAVRRIAVRLLAGQDSVRLG